MNACYPARFADVEIVWEAAPPDLTPTFEGARRVANPTALPALRPGQQVILTDRLRDGDAYANRSHVYIGSRGRPMRTHADELEHARDMGRWIAQDRFRNHPACRNLPYPPRLPPAPKPLGNGERLYARLTTTSRYPY